MHTLFLFGAGASFGSGNCFPCNPPLGRDLFARMRVQGGVAGEVPTMMAMAFARDPETAMDTFFVYFHNKVPRLMRQMAAYLAGFQLRPENNYLRLLREIKKSKRKVTFASLNYDLLLEEAICAVGAFITYWPPVPHNNYLVIKPHGSCNFLPDMKECVIKNGTVNIQNAPNSPILCAEVLPARSSNDVLAFCAEQEQMQTPFFPAIAMYARGKRLLSCPEFVQAHQHGWKQAAQEADQVIVLGVAVNENDSHIWGALAETSAAVYFVGPDYERFGQWADHRRCGKPTTRAIARNFEDAIPVIASHLAGNPA